MGRVQQLSAQRLHMLHQQISRCLAGSQDAAISAMPNGGADVVLDAQSFISDHLSLEVNQSMPFFVGAGLYIVLCVVYVWC